MVLKYGTVDNIIYELNRVYNIEYPKAKQGHLKLEETIKTDLTDEPKEELPGMEE